MIKGKYEVMPDFYTRPFYYLAVVGQIALGGLVAHLAAKVGTTDMQSLLAGYAAPNIITSLAASKAEVPVRGAGFVGGIGQPKFSLLRWWR